MAVDTNAEVRLPDETPPFVKVIVVAKAGAANNPSKVMHTTKISFIVDLPKAVMRCGPQCTSISLGGSRQRL